MKGSLISLQEKKKVSCDALINSQKAKSKFSVLLQLACLKQTAWSDYGKDNYL